MLSQLSLYLEAHNCELNCHRFYKFEVGINLLGLWSVETYYGRIKNAGRSKGYMADSIHEAQKIFKTRLKKRLNAKARIGCNYIVKKLEAEQDIVLAHWLPENTSTSNCLKDS